MKKLIAALALVLVPLVWASPASAQTTTTYQYQMTTFSLPGTTWAGASIAIDPTGTNTFGWLMAYADGENFIQVGWWDSAQEYVIPFWEQWSSKTYGYVGSSVDLPQSGSINVAIANEPNSTVWDLYVQEGQTWAKVYSAVTSFSASQVQWKISTESHNQTPVPSLCAGAGFNTGAFQPYPMGSL